ncbi:GH32 C-terminal domain-containing protein [Mollicutes bacterium LVI A0075]|nr:GH32 C-terminal domain-containing protein [Mollicutes bacterium LVI A0075]
MNRYTSHVYTKFENLKPQQLIDDAQLVKTDMVNYPKVHIAPKSGLLNDPNGLVYYNELYHIFYQACPNGPFHGMKSWNLVTTKDFLTYEDHGIVLNVTEEYENFGIFSGGAIIVDSKLCLLYTANYRDPNNEYKRKAYQVLATLDENYNVVSKRIIREPDETLHTEHFRDPVAIDDFNVLIGLQDVNNQGQLAVMGYSQKDYLGDSKLSFIKNSWNLDSFMFECPNLFKLEDKNILVFSPQGVEAQDKYTFNNIHDVVYSISDKFFIEEMMWDNPIIKQLDHGFDFYAPQVFNDGERTLMIGWQGVPDTIYPGDEQYRWSQMLTTMRELTLVNGNLLQKPIDEYQQLETNWISFEREVKLESKVFKLKFSASEEFELVIGNDSYNIRLVRQGNEISLDRSKCQYLVNEKYGNVRYVNVEEDNCELEIIVDMSSIEIFINEGKYVMTSRFFIDSLTTLKLSGSDTSQFSYLKAIKYKER